MIRDFLYVLFGTLLTVSASGQISFRQSAAGHTAGFHSGIAVMVTDVNGDGRDDIVRMHRGNRVTVTLQGQDERFLTTFTYQINGGEQWNLTGGDLNNDGGFDILTSGVYDRVKVFRSVPFSTDFTYGTVGGNNFFGQAANVVDINNDGYLDYFVCHDDAASVTFLNDSTGNLVRVDTIIDFTTNPPSDKSGNYGSIWTDIDSDGDLDLYISKCRVGVNDPTDPRRINVLYLNNGDGTFTEEADSFNLAIGAQSWTADFGDIDNDGDFDAFVANHNVPAQLLVNIDNKYFVDITDSSGISVSGLTMQGSFRDFDNDGLLDLIATGTSISLYHNVGNSQFELVTKPFSDRTITSYGIGDLNSDGYLDLYATYNELYNDPSNVFEDAIWLNNGSNNHFLDVRLIGTQCNRNAIGARIMLYGEWGVQTREVHAGESYGITNSFNQHFGIGQSETIDSIVIVWPNHLREMHAVPGIDRTIVITEGGCVTELRSLQQGPYTQCDQEQFTITAPDGYVGYLWSTGDTAREITVSVPGVYHVSLTDDTGCEWIAGPVIISPEEDIEPESISLTVEGNTHTCEGDSIVLSGPQGAESYLWNTGETQPEIVATESGTYVLQASYECKVLTSDTVVLNIIDPNDLTIEGDTIYGPESVTLVAQGDSILWYEEIDGTPVGSGMHFITPLLDTSATFYAQQISIVPGEPLTVGPTEHSGGTLYNSGTSNGALRFNALSRFRLDSVLVFTDFPGDRTLIILNITGDTIFRRTYAINTGATYLPLNFWIDPAPDYLLTTDRETNQMTFGVVSPRLVRSDDGFLYPFVQPGVVELTGTASGQQFYYYFYDWHLTTEPTYCQGDFIPVEVVFVDTTSSIQSLRVEEFNIIPNPAGSVITLSIPDHSDITAIALLDIHGRQVSGWHPLPGGNRLFVDQLAQGMYVVRIEMDDMLYIGRFMKF